MRCSSPSAHIPTDFGRTCRLVPALEQLITPDNLRVSAVLHFHPCRVAVLDRVPALAMLGHDALQIALAGQLEPGARPRPQRGLRTSGMPNDWARHAAAPSFSRSVADALDPRRSGAAGRRREACCTPPEQELIELAATVRVQAGDLTVEDGVPGFQRELDPGAQLGEAGEPVPIPGTKTHAGRIAVGQGAEPIVLDFEKPVFVGEGLGTAGERQWLEGREHGLSINVGCGPPDL